MRSIVFAITVMLFASGVQAQGLIYVEDRLNESGEPNGFGDLYYVNVDSTGSSLTATAPLRISPPQPADGGVLFGLPNFGNPDQVLYFATQEDPDKMEIFLLDLNALVSSVKINAELAANEKIGGGITTPDGTSVIYTVTTEIVPGSVETVDLYMVSINNPGIATKLNPELSDGAQVGEFAISPDSSRVIYAAQINGSAEELFVTELSNPGVAVKADAASSISDYAISDLMLDRNGTRAFWIGGSGAMGADRNLLTVPLNDFGNVAQINGALATGALIVDYDVSSDGATIVYRQQDSIVEISDVFLVNLGAGTPSTPAQVNPDWADGAFPSALETVGLLDGGTQALYNGPIDVAETNELYETPLNALQTVTKLNDTLTPPAFGGPPQMGIFSTNQDESLVLYLQFLFDSNAISVVERNNPGVATLPVAPTADQRPLGSVPIFGPGDLIATSLLNTDTEGSAVSGELHVADARVSGSNVRVSPEPFAGEIVLSYFWLPAAAPTAIVTDSDGDGAPNEDDAFPDDPSETTDTDGDGIGNNADTDDDNDGVLDVDDNYPLGRFDDARPGDFAFSFIEALVRSGITAGCGGTDYCPNDEVTRAQMAVFLERGMRGSNYRPPSATGTVLNDVGAGDFAAAWIEQLFADGITSGCGGGNYCPDDSVTRAQMAVFLLRAKYGSSYVPPAASGVFTDVPQGNFAINWIEQLAAEGVTSGCGPDIYCPNDPVTRAQMAVFLVKTFEL